MSVGGHRKNGATERDHARQEAGAKDDYRMASCLNGTRPLPSGRGRAGLTPLCLCELDAGRIEIATAPGEQVLMGRSAGPCRQTGASDHSAEQREEEGQTDHEFAELSLARRPNSGCFMPNPKAQLDIEHTF